MPSRVACWILALTAPVALPVAARAEPAAVVIVLDASAAMDRPVPGGGTRLDAAKEALRAVVASLPPGTPVGLRVYGSDTAATDRDAGCRGTRLVTPVAPLDAVRFTASLDGVTAGGRPALGDALRHAADDMPGAARPTVVLVSSGSSDVDGCGTPEPCAVARSLAALAIPARTHAVGFALGDDRRGRDELRCVGEEGGGTFAEAVDTTSLARAVRAPTVAALGVRAAPGGTAVRGGTDPVTAPPIGSGPYVDTLPRGAPRYYAVEVGPGQRLAAAASLDSAPIPACPGELEVALLTPALTEPRYAPGRRRGALDAGAAVSVRTAHAAADPWTRDTDEDPSGTWWVRVTATAGRCREAVAVVPYAVRLSVTLRGGTASPLSVGTPLRGGATVAGAALLPPDARPVTDALAAGERRWWRFPAVGGTEAHARVVLGGVPGGSCRATLRARLLGRDGAAVDAGSVRSDARDPVALRLDSAGIEPGAAGTWYVETELFPGPCGAARPVRLLAEVRPSLAPVAEPVPVRGAIPRNTEAARRLLAAVLLGSALAVTLVAMLVVAVARRRRSARGGRSVAVAPGAVVSTPVHEPASAPPPVAGALRPPEPEPLPGEPEALRGEPEALLGEPEALRGEPLPPPGAGPEPRSPRPEPAPANAVPAVRSPEDAPLKGAPPEAVPPQAVGPASDVSPTDVSPADVPPTDVPPADVPPADVPPTDVPPADVPPADVPPADVPPADVPPADVPPADVPPTIAPPTAPPPDDGLYHRRLT
jgi:hypothetical protein